MDPVCGLFVVFLKSLATGRLFRCSSDLIVLLHLHFRQKSADAVPVLLVLDEEIRVIFTWLLLTEEFVARTH